MNNMTYTTDFLHQLHSLTYLNCRDNPPLSNEISSPTNVFNSELPANLVCTQFHAI